MEKKRQHQFGCDTPCPHAPGGHLYRPAYASFDPSKPCIKNHERRLKLRSECGANDEKVFKKNRGECYYCETRLTLKGSKGKPRNWVVEHIVPRVEGGPDCLDNFMPSCVPCNLSKGRKALGEFCDSDNPCLGPERDGLLDEWNDDLPVQAVEDLAKFNRLILSEYVCALFYAPWCQACQIFRPKFNEESKRYSGIKFISVSYDRCPDIYELFWRDETVYFPTVIFFSRNRQIFLDQVSAEQLRKTLREWAPGTHNAPRAAVAKPAPRAVAKPAPRAVAKPAPRAVTKPAPRAAVTKPAPTAQCQVNKDYKEVVSRMSSVSVSSKRQKCKVILQSGPKKGTECGRSKPCPYHDK